MEKLKLRTCIRELGFLLNISGFLNHDRFKVAKRKGDAVRNKHPNIRDNS